VVQWEMYVAFFAVIILCVCVCVCSDELFDVVADNLVHCGQACLRRLSALIMEDIGENLQEVS
jgi:hypothetical protein